jgi:hypothetical protein
MPPAGALRLRDGKISYAEKVAGRWVVPLLAIPPTVDPGGAEPEPGPLSRSFVQSGAPP